MKRILCAVCCALLLGGCSMIKENNAPVPPVKGEAGGTKAAEAGPGKAKVPLYFLDGSEDRLAAEPRTIALEEEKDPAAAAMEALIGGPEQASGLRAVAPSGISLDRVETSDKLASVYLRTQGDLPSDQERFLFEAAAADTLTDFLSVSFVSVFWNGVSAGRFDEPAGPLSKYTGNMTDAYSKAESDAILMSTEGARESRTVLYYPSADGLFLLPEVQNVVCTGDDYAKAVIDELKKAPGRQGGKIGVLDKDTQLVSAQLAKETGGNVLTLNFSGLSQPASFGDTESEILSYAAIVYSLTGFIIGVDRVRIFSDGEEVKGLAGFRDFPEGMARADFAPLLGKSVHIYLMYKNSSLLTGVSRTIAQSDQQNAKNRLIELIKGPNDRDADTAWPVIPAGIGPEDILGVSAAGDTVTLDLSKNFQARCKGLSEESETLLVYGIVNTLSEVYGIRKVQFLIEGKSVSELAGHLYMQSPFLKNPGLIKS